MDKKSAKQAIKIGDDLAAAALVSRSKALKKRTASLQGKTKKFQPPKFVAGSPPKMGNMGLLGGELGNNGVLVAEGDSWFDYPLNDVLGCLEDEHGYVDLRGTLRNDVNTYAKDWANELHPTGNGFSLVTQKFASILRKLP